MSFYFLICLYFLLLFFPSFSSPLAYGLYILSSLVSLLLPSLLYFFYASPLLLPLLYFSSPLYFFFLSSLLFILLVSPLPSFLLASFLDYPFSLLSFLLPLCPDASFLYSLLFLFFVFPLSSLFFSSPPFFISSSSSPSPPLSPHPGGEDITSCRFVFGVFGVFGVDAQSDKKLGCGVE